MHGTALRVCVVACALAAACGTSSGAADAAEAREPSIDGVVPLASFEISQGAAEIGVVMHEVDTVLIRSDGTLSLTTGQGQVLRTTHVSASELDRIARMAAAPWFVRMQPPEVRGGERNEAWIKLRSPTRNYSVRVGGEDTPELRFVFREIFRLRKLVETLAPEPESAPACATDADCTFRACGCTGCEPRHPTEPPITRICRPARCAASPCRTYRPVCDPTVHRCALVRTP